MGENLAIEGRSSVRSPMQWTDEQERRLLAARHPRAWRVRSPRAGSDRMAVNVAAQRRDPDSLLNWMERVIRRRRETPEIGWGAGRCSTPIPRRCWATGAIGKAARSWRSTTWRAIRARSSVPLGPDLPENPRMMDLFDREGEMQEIDGSTFEVKLEGYGYRWLRIQSADRHVSP